METNVVTDRLRRRNISERPDDLDPPLEFLSRNDEDGSDQDESERRGRRKNGLKTEAFAHRGADSSAERNRTVVQ